MPSILTIGIGYFRYLIYMFFAIFCEKFIQNFFNQLVVEIPFFKKNSWYITRYGDLLLFIKLNLE
jgi:hypothetical protein